MIGNGDGEDVVVYEEDGEEVVEEEVEEGDLSADINS